MGVSVYKHETPAKIFFSQLMNMNEMLQDGGAWLVAGSLMLIGVLGCVVPIIPGHLLILFGAICFRWIAGVEAGIAWWGFAILILLMVISQVFEMISGSLGSRWFGGTKWGAIGALIGAVVGIFFVPFGILIGPLLGAFGCELLFGKQKTRSAAASGVGSMVGTLAGIGFKLGIGVLMVAYFVGDIFLY